MGWLVLAVFAILQYFMVLTAVYLGARVLQLFNNSAPAEDLQPKL